MATAPVNSAAFYADFGKLESLRSAAQKDPQAAAKAAAKQFEGIFTQMMLKTMRAASMGEGLGDSEETKFYQDMFDQQLSVQLSAGKGIGLADRLLAQLQRSGLTPGGTTQPATPAAPMPLAAPAAPLALPLPAAGAQGDANAPAAPPLRAPVINGLQPVAQPAAPATQSAPVAQQSRRQDFIDSIRPAAERVAQRLGVATEAVIAHAALETGWGQHLPSASGNNLFGIKAGGSWQGASAVAATTEVGNGQPQRVQAGFRSYGSLAEGLEDYGKVLGGNPRYAQALNQGSNVAAFAQGLQRGGYATDPAYASKLVATAAAVRELAAAQPLKNAAPLPTTPTGGTA
jgi:peptidoglycan hydrolase FlgJ